VFSPMIVGETPEVSASRSGLKSPSGGNGGRSVKIDVSATCIEMDLEMGSFPELPPCSPLAVRTTPSMRELIPEAKHFFAGACCFSPTDKATVETLPVWDAGEKNLTLETRTVAAAAVMEETRDSPSTQYHSRNGQPQDDARDDEEYRDVEAYDDEIEGSKNETLVALSLSKKLEQMRLHMQELITVNKQLLRQYQQVDDGSSTGASTSSPRSRRGKRDKFDADKATENVNLESPEEVQAKCATLESELETLFRQTSSLISEKQLKDDDSHRRMMNLETQVSELMSGNQAKKAQAASLPFISNEPEDKSSAMTSELHTLQNQLELLASDTERYKIERDEAQATLGTTLEEAAQSESKYVSLLASLTEKYEMAEKEHQEYVSSTNSQIAFFKSQVFDQQKTIDMMTGELQTSKESEVGLHKEYSENFEEELRRAAVKTANYRVQLEYLESDLEKTQEMMQATQEENSKLRQEVSELSQLINKLSTDTQAQSLDDENARLRQELVEMSEVDDKLSKDTTTQEIAALSQVIEKQSADTQTQTQYEEENSKLRQEIAELSQVIEKQSADTQTQYEEENSKLRQEIAELSQVIEKQSADTQTQTQDEEENAKLRQEVVELSQAMEKLSAETQTQIECLREDKEEAERIFEMQLCEERSAQNEIKDRLTKNMQAALLTERALAEANMQAALLSERALAEARYNDLVAQKEKDDKIYRQLEVDTSAIKAELALAVEEVTSQRKCANELRDQLDAEVEEKSALTVTVGELNQQLDAAVEEKSSLAVTVDDLDQQLKTVQAQNEQLQARAQSSHFVRNLLPTFGLPSLSARQTSENQQLKFQLEEAVNQLTDLEMTNFELQSKLDTIEQKLASYTEMTKDAQLIAERERDLAGKYFDELEQQKASAKETQIEVDRLTKQLESYIVQVMLYEEKLEAEYKSVAALKAEKESLRNDVDEAKEDTVRRLAGMNSIHETMLTEVETRMEMMESAKEHLVEEVSIVRERCAFLESQVSEERSKFDDASKEATQNEHEKIKCLLAEKNELEDQVKTLKEKCASLASNLSEARANQKGPRQCEDSPATPKRSGTPRNKPQDRQQQEDEFSMLKEVCISLEKEVNDLRRRQVEVPRAVNRAIDIGHDTYEFDDVLALKDVLKQEIASRESAEAALSDLQKTVATTNASLAQLKTELEEAKTINIKISDDYAQTSESLVHSDLSLLQEIANRERVEAAMSELHKTLEMTEVTLTQITAELDEEKKHNSKISSEHAQTSQSLVETEQNLLREIASREGVEATLSELQKTLETTDGSLARLAAELEEQKKINTKINDEHAQTSKGLVQSGEHLLQEIARREGVEATLLELQKTLETTEASLTQLTAELNEEKRMNAEMNDEYAQTLENFVQREASLVQEIANQEGVETALSKLQKTLETTEASLTQVMAELEEEKKVNSQISDEHTRSSEVLLKTEHNLLQEIANRQLVEASLSDLQKTLETTEASLVQLTVELEEEKNINCQISDVHARSAEGLVQREATLLQEIASRERAELTCSELQKTLEMTEATVVQLKAELEEEKKTITAEATKNKEIISSLRSQIVSLDEEKTTIQNEAAGMNAEALTRIEELYSGVFGMEQLITELKDQARQTEDIARARLDEALEKINSLIAEKKTIEMRLEKEVKRSSSDRSLSEAELASTKKDLEVARETLEETEQELQTVHRKMVAAGERHALRLRSIDEAHAQDLDRAASQVEMLKKQKNDLLAAEKANAEARAIAWNSEAMGYKKEIQTQADKLAAVETESASLKDQLQCLRVEYEKTTTSMKTEHERQMDELSRTLKSAMRAVTEDATAQYLVLETEAESLRTRLHETASSLSKRESELTSVRAELAQTVISHEEKLKNVHLDNSSKLSEVMSSKSEIEFQSQKLQEEAKIEFDRLLSFIQSLERQLTEGRAAASAQLEEAISNATALEQQRKQLSSLLAEATDEKEKRGVELEQNLREIALLQTELIEAENSHKEILSSVQVEHSRQLERTMTQKSDVEARAKRAQVESKKELDRALSLIEMLENQAAEFRVNSSSQLGKANLTIQSLEQHCGELSTQLADVTEEKKRQLAELELNISEIKERLSETENALETAKQECTVTTARLASTEHELERTTATSRELQALLAASNEENSQLQNKRELASKENADIQSDLKAQNLELAQRIEELVQQLDRQMMEYKDVSARQLKSEKKIHTYMGSLSALSTQLNETTALYTGLQVLHQELEQRLEATRVDLGTEVAEHRTTSRRLAEIVEEKASVATQNEILKKRVELFNAERGKLERDIQQLRFDSDQTEETLISSIAEAKTKESQLSNENATLASENGDLKQQIMSLKVDKEKLDQDIQQLTSQLQQTQETLSSSMTDTKAKEFQWHSDLVKADTKCAILTKERDSLLSDLDDLNQTLASLTSELDHTRERSILSMADAKTRETQINSENESLASENGNLKEEIEILTGNREKLDRDIQQLTFQLQETQETLTSSLADAKAKEFQLQSELVKTETKCTILTKERDALSSGMKDLNETLDSLRSDKERLELELTSEKSEMKNVLAAHGEALNTSATNMRELEFKNKTLQTELEVLGTKLHESKDDLSALTSRFLQMSTDKENVCGEYEKMTGLFHAAKDRIATLESDLSEAGNKLEQAISKSNLFESDLQKRVVEVSESQSHVKELQKRLEELQAKMNDEVAKKTKALDDMTAVKMSLDSTIVSLESKISEIEQNKAQVTNELQEERTKLSHMKQSLTSVASVLEEVSSSNKALSSHVTELEQQLETGKQDLATAESQLKELREQHINLENTIKALNEDMESARASVAEAEEHGMNLKAEMAKVREESADEKFANTLLKNFIGTLNSTNDALQTKCNKLEAQMESSVPIDRLGMLTEERNALSKNEKLLNSRIDSLEASNEKLEHKLKETATANATLEEKLLESKDTMSKLTQTMTALTRESKQSSQAAESRESSLAKEVVSLQIQIETMKRQLKKHRSTEQKQGLAASKSSAELEELKKNYAQLESECHELQLEVTQAREQCTIVTDDLEVAIARGQMLDEELQHAEHSLMELTQQMAFFQQQDDYAQRRKMSSNSRQRGSPYLEVTTTPTNKSRGLSIANSSIQEDFQEAASDDSEEMPYDQRSKTSSNDSVSVQREHPDLRQREQQQQQQQQLYRNDSPLSSSSSPAPDIIMDARACRKQSMARRSIAARQPPPPSPTPPLLPKKGRVTFDDSSVHSTYSTSRKSPSPIMVDDRSVDSAMHSRSGRRSTTPTLTKDPSFESSATPNTESGGSSQKKKKNVSFWNRRY